MKKYIEIVFCLLFCLVASVFIFNHFKMKNETYKNTIVNMIKNNSEIIVYEDGIVTIDYNKLDNYFINRNNVYIINDIAKEKYHNIINQTLDIILNDKSVKMYKKSSKTILEYKLNKNKAQKIFTDIVDIEDDVIVKIYFKIDKKYNDIDVEKIYYKLNHEEVNRANIVKTLQVQVDNTGEKYWKWYGFNHRVEWCAVFVSWVANENGQIKNGNIPKFIWVKKGVDFFKEKKRFKYRYEYTPKPADIIFFDWNNNGVIDHVGYVEKVTKNYIYTIEGNVKYLYVKRKKYNKNSSFIYGYGIPNY